MIDVENTRFMPVSVYETSSGNLMLCQEWPSMDRGERFMRVAVNMEDAEKLAMHILSVARASRSGGGG